MHSQFRKGTFQMANLESNKYSYFILISDLLLTCQKSENMKLIMDQMEMSIRNLFSRLFGLAIFSTVNSDHYHGHVIVGLPGFVVHKHGLDILISCHLLAGVDGSNLTCSKKKKKI